VRLAFNVGRDHEIMPGDLVGVIAGVTRLPREMIGRIDLEPQRSLVDVAAEHAGRVLKKLNGYSGQRPQAERRDPEVGSGWACRVSGESSASGRRPPALYSESS
jgi:ATP-dependent RNA helicase DeaD